MPLVEQDRFCETCGTALVSVGEGFIRTEIEFIPAKVRVIDYYARHLNAALDVRMGNLHTDAYSGYKKVPEITRCLCWTHLRRNFVDAIPKNI